MYIFTWSVSIYVNPFAAPCEQQSLYHAFSPQPPLPPLFSLTIPKKMNSTEVQNPRSKLDDKARPT